MHIGGMGEDLGVLLAALKVGQKAKGLESPSERQSAVLANSDGRGQPDCG